MFLQVPPSTFHNYGKAKYQQENGEKPHCGSQSKSALYGLKPKTKHQKGVLELNGFLVHNKDTEGAENTGSHKENKDLGNGNNIS